MSGLTDGDSVNTLISQGVYIVHIDPADRKVRDGSCSGNFQEKFRSGRDEIRSGGAGKKGPDS